LKNCGAPITWPPICNPRISGAAAVSFTEVLMILWRRSWIVALTFITAIVLALVIIKVVPARFDAEATASMDPNGVDPVTSIATSDAMNQTLVHGNMMTLVTSSRVAHDVVKRLNLTAGTQNQADYRASKSFGKESIEDWLSVTLAKNVEARFIFGTNVLSIKYKTTDPSIAAEVANTFLAATVDATVEMKTESAE